MSRYPAMSQAPLPYDRSLLAAAPSLTRQDRQAGYDVNALEQGTYTQPGPTNTRTMGQDQPAAPPASDPFGDQYGDRNYSPTPTSGDQRPWWKRKRWAALALIIFIGIICGIIAGVVTARNSRNTSNLVTTPESQNQDNNNVASLTSSSSPAVGATPTRTTATPVMTSDPRNPNNGNTGNVGNGNGNGGVTVVIGRPTTTLPPGVILPTATGQPAPDDPFGSDEIPLICYVTPTSRQCAPYFEDDPPRLF
ncbi:hypothetical protein M408DRAFT_195813 [Serendipita vermifera MAFF 305830]|uniref:Uncharacterized protein n=1 Tax=Serendipita vermifera MAFF 305830 TaxID=933852 RepID=A0A0C2XAW5_SERVB|nr:hypothetical protein M408DRAFT_195813 [Serendipita vermifera MAFF 305830]